MAVPNSFFSLNSVENRLDVYINDDSSVSFTSGPNTQFNFVSEDGHVALNGVDLPAQSDIQNLQDEIDTLQQEIDALEPANVQAITQSILFPGVDTFSSQPFQVALKQGDTPPTTSADFIAVNGSRLVVNDVSNTGSGGIAMKDSNTLTLDSNKGAGIINFTGSELLFNGSPLPSGNVPLSQCFEVPAENTFTSAPIQINSIDSASCEMLLKNGGRISLMTPDTSGISTIETDPSNNVNITCNSLLVNGVPVGGGGSSPVDAVFSVIPDPSTYDTKPINLIQQDGKSTDMQLLAGSQLSLYDTLNSSLTYIKNDSANLSLNALAGDVNINTAGNLKLVNTDLIVNHGTANLKLSIEDLYGTASFTGAGTYAFSSSMLVQGGDGFQIQRAGNYCKIKPDAGYAQFNTDAPSGYNLDSRLTLNDQLAVVSVAPIVEPKCVWVNGAKYVEMKFLTNTTNELSFNNSENGDYTFTGGIVSNNGLQLQPIHTVGSLAGLPVGVTNGYMCFVEDSINKPVWKKGSSWYYADGTVAI